MDHSLDLEKNTTDTLTENVEAKNFIEQAIEEDLALGGQFEGETFHSRFPPEPNGYLHIGHAKALFIDFEMAKKFNGLCNLRMDDTNPIREDVEYIQAIKEDIKWLGYDYADRFYYASSYFDKMYEIAVNLIKQGLAYVCDLTSEEIRTYRGTLTEPGKNSPYRDRSVSENLHLFEEMKKGAFKDGSKTLRAKIDMSSGNINMRDPVLYRISHAYHHRTKNEWCIYPMYDFAHPIEDALESITHSMCSIEFENHRPLYDWVVAHSGLSSKPRQIEFARLNINYTVMSKRKLIHLVESNIVNGWDDPRMPTLCGLKRRGYTPTAIKNFIRRCGVSKVPNTVEYGFLEYCIREDLNEKATRKMAVLDPVLLTITNYPDEKTEYLDGELHPNRPNESYPIAFSKHLYIDRSDFMIDPPKKYFRLYKGNEVRLKHAYMITCTDYDVDENGCVTHIYATYDPNTRGGKSNDGRKVKGTIHFVDQKTAIDATVRLYDNLFTVPDPDSAENGYESVINPKSFIELQNCKLEASLQDAKLEEGIQFIRHGYFCLDKDSTKEHLIFNRTVSLKDSFKLKK